MKTTMMTATITLAPLVLWLAPCAAQDDLLVIERSADQAGRSRLLTALAKVRAKEFLLVDARPDDVVAYLRTVTGNKVSFNFASKSKELQPKVTLRLANIDLANAMRVIETTAAFRFVYRSGAILMRPASEVKEFRFLRSYDLRAATFAVPQFRAPRLGLGSEASGPAEDAEPVPLLFSADRLVELIRTHVLPESWDHDGISISQTNGILLIRQTASGQRAVYRFLAQLGVVTAPREQARTTRTARQRHEKKSE